MKQFIRDDGHVVEVVPGFRKRVLEAPRISVQPKPEWDDEAYRAAAGKKIAHSERFVQEFLSFGGVLEGARMLEAGCGAGIDCFLMALRPVQSVVGIDMELPLLEQGEKGDRTRRLLQEVVADLSIEEDPEKALARANVQFLTMDARRMSFPDNSFDLLWSRAAMEHIAPPEDALAEMARIVRPGGLIFHSIDPFYWLKGCHKGGMVDIPWAHARLTPAEYRRFVAEGKGEPEAVKRSQHLETLNQLTPRRWRTALEAQPFEVLDWKEEVNPLAEALLAEFPDARETLLDGIEDGDLTCGQIKVWLRNKESGQPDESLPEEGRNA